MTCKLLTAAVLLALAAGGCTPKTVVLAPAEPPAKRISKIDALKAQIAELQRTVKQQTDQIDTLQALGDKRLDTLFHVDHIELGRYSGGIDTDKLPGDDLLVVYLTPIDQYGSGLKAAGDIHIRIFDLALPETDTLIGDHSWTAEQSAALWPRGFMGKHFRLECPWTTRPPQHGELTVRVEFTDYLTGKTFSAQKLCTVKLPTAPKAR